MSEWEDKSDDELASLAEQGLRGQGPAVEAMRRLRRAIAESQQATTKAQHATNVFTVVLMGFTAALIVLSFFTLLAAE